MGGTFGNQGLAGGTGGRDKSEKASLRMGKKRIELNLSREMPGCFWIFAF